MQGNWTVREPLKHHILIWPKPLQLFLYTPLFWFYAISIWANAISMFVSLGGGTWSLCIKLTVPHPIPKLVSPTS